MRSFIFLTTLVFSWNISAEDLKPLRRWVVFPFAAADEKLKPVADQAWWKCREKITEKKRFLVASKQLLVQKDVYQPRKTLNIDDAKYLAQLMEADVVVTGFSEYRDFTLNAYLAQTGQLLWTAKVGFHPSLKADEQLLKSVQTLTSQLLDKIPYQGLVVNSEEKIQNGVAVDVGNNTNLREGDEIQFVEITLPDNMSKEDPLGFDKIKTYVITEGRVTKIKKNYAVVDVKKSLDALTEDYFVVIPKEKKQAGYQEGLALEMVPALEDETPKDGSHSKQMVIFGSVFSFLGLLLLAF